LERKDVRKPMVPNWNPVLFSNTPVVRSIVMIYLLRWQPP